MSVQNLRGVTMKGDNPLTEESEYSKIAKQLNNPNSGPPNLNLNHVSFDQFYVVEVNGVRKSQPVGERILAEQFIAGLSQPEQTEARIVPVTASGQEILMG